MFILTRFPKISRFITALVKDVRGGVMVYTGMILPVAVGSIGLTLDVATWHLQAKSVQAAADAAAMGAALEIMRTSSTNAVSAGHEAAGKH
ncbi:MAG: pilus assembly protein TadG-related protein, partial [Alphaproteobacteria bacterium]|nr:pilus assembly protein TadG-related protein [Alphaproteobacteria bacterium]